MAYERIPSGAEWIEICETEDEVEQNRKLRNYICDLQERIRDLEQQEALQKDIDNLVSLILKSNIFKEYMRKHDRDVVANEHRDWSGLQGGV